MTTLIEEPLVADSDLHRDVRVESLLKEWNIAFELDPEYPLGKLDADYDESQVRDPQHRAPRENVEEYEVQMRAGAVFPPLVATHNGRLIDGNTRKAAAGKVGRDTYPVYLVKLPQASYGPMIGAALNQMGGKRLTPEEAFAAAETMIRNGHTDEAIARTIGKSPQSVRNYRRQTRFKDAADRTGVAELRIKPAAQRHLADIKLDEPFKEAAKLAAEANLSPADVKDLVVKIDETRSEGQALEVIGEIRAKHGPVGPPPRKTNQTKAATMAGRKIDAFLAAVNQPAGELAPAALRADLEPKWVKLRDLTSRVLEAFAEAPPELPLEAPTES